MTDGEGRALARTAGVLLVASLARWGLAARAGPAVLPEDSATSLPGLLEESTRERDEAARRRTPLADGERLDPNLADEIDLDRLPGLGPAAAKAIVAAREQGSSFAAPEDLLGVRGIGPATLEKMRDHLEFSGSPPSRRVLGTAAASGSAATKAKDAAPIEPISLNQATAAELERLPGVGPALAKRILDEREKRGGFASVDDLESVRGIGPATLDRLRPLLGVP